METAVRVEHLVKHFNHIKAVDDISFRIEKGELFGFLGVNGAGKSTTINILCTLFPQTAGTVEICGCRLGKENEEIRRKIGMVRQNNCLDDDLSVKENLLVRGSLYERDRIKLHKKLADVCEMMGLQDVRLQGLSCMCRRFCFWMNPPRVWILPHARMCGKVWRN